jgi:predicted CXXCH cytochrome family protein
MSLLLMALSLRADIRVTPHNLARYKDDPAASAEELCVFCHTPTVSEGVAAAPRWQRNLDAAHIFPTFDDIGAGDPGAGRVGSHSVVCLSCHDALQAAAVGIPAGSAPAITPDHPVGVPYRGPLDGAAQPRRRDSEYRPASRGMVGGRTAWWVSPRGPGLPRERGDLPFFPGAAPQGGEAVPLIECGTCHDPHSPNRLFLRATSPGSMLCLTCHDK